MPDRLLRCESCGSEFGCSGRSGGCWCNDVAVDALALGWLRERFGDCLCPACLASRGGEADAPAAAGTTT